MTPHPHNTTGASGNAVADILRDAAKVLDTKGWTQGVEMDRDGRCCAMGAIRLAVTGGVNRSPADRGEFDILLEAEDLVEAVLDGQAVDFWNDAPGRTVDEVKAALLAAAERAR